MVTLANIDGRTLVANVQPGLQGLARAFGTPQTRAQQAANLTLTQGQIAAQQAAQQLAQQRAQQAAQSQADIKTQLDILTQPAQIPSAEAARAPGERFGVTRAPRAGQAGPGVPRQRRTQQEKRLDRVSAINLGAGQTLGQILEVGTPEQQQEFRQASVEGLALANRVKKAPTFEDKKRLINEEGARLAREGGDLTRVIDLQNKTEGDLNLELDRMRIVGKDIVDSIPQAQVREGLFSTPEKQAAFTRFAAQDPQAARVMLEAEKQRADFARGPEQFEAVFNEQGQIVAQRSTKTGRVVQDPRAGAAGGQRGTFTKSPGVIIDQGDGNFAQSIPVMDSRTGQIVDTVVPIAGQPVSRLGESGEQQTQRAVQQAFGTAQVRRGVELETAAPIAGATRRGAAEETRGQTAINEGLTAADSIPILNRSIELLDSVETGGLDRALLAGKQLFGVESANEAELSANLGKTVLSQLRNTFGAAFTEREGARLARIEAGFGKSVAGNKRLLLQTKRLMERVANRGIKRAENAGDQISADEIREAMGFTLTPVVAGEETAPETTPQVLRFDAQGNLIQ